MSFLLEWQKPSQMGSHIYDNLNANENFVIFIIYLWVHYKLYWHSFTYFRFHFGNEIPVNCLFTKGK